MTVDEMLAAIENIRHEMGWDTPEFRRRQAQDAARLAALKEVERIEAKARAATTMRQINALQAELDRIEPTYQEALARISQMQF